MAILVGAAIGIYLANGTSVVVIAVSIALAAVITSATNPEREAAKQRLKDLQKGMRGLQEIWAKQAGNIPFLSKQSELIKLKEEYQDLPSLWNRKKAALEADRKTAQLRRFLDGYRIDRARIPGIGESRKVTLQSFGIETALDIDRNNVLRIPASALSWPKY